MKLLQGAGLRPQGTRGAGQLFASPGAQVSTQSLAPSLAERGGGDFKILFAELTEAWLPQLSGIPQGPGRTDRGSTGWESLSSDVKWRPREVGTSHLVGSFLLPGKWEQIPAHQMWLWVSDEL